MLSSAKSFELLANAQPGRFSPSFVDLRASKETILDRDSQPVAFLGPKREGRAFHNHMSFLVSHQKNCLAVFKTVDYRSLAHEVTWKGTVFDTVFPPALAVTTMLQVPGLVLLPTFQLQVTVPSCPAVWGPRPEALLGPLL